MKDAKTVVNELLEDTGGAPLAQAADRLMNIAERLSGIVPRTRDAHPNDAVRVQQICDELTDLVERYDIGVDSGE